MKRLTHAARRGSVIGSLVAVAAALAVGCAPSTEIPGGGAPGGGGGAAPSSGSGGTASIPSTGGSRGTGGALGSGGGQSGGAGDTGSGGGVVGTGGGAASTGGSTGNPVGTGGRVAGGTGGSNGTGGRASSAGGANGAAGGAGGSSLPPGCVLPTPVRFQTDVQPFLITTCGGTGCHVIDGASTMASGGFNHAYDWVTAGAHASSCPEVPTPKRFEVTIAVINAANPPTCSRSRKMPPQNETGAALRAPLSACQVATLQAWLNEPLVTQMHRADDSSPTTPYPMPPFN